MTAAPSLLGPNARPVVQIGGDAAWKSRYFRASGIICSFQWIDLRQHGFEDTQDHACVPCMVLLRPGSTSKGAHVIPQPHAYLYGTRKGHPTAHLGTSAFDACVSLELDTSSRQNVRAVIDIIIEGLPDLVCMPSEPPDSLDAVLKKHTHGIELTARINGKKIHEELL